MVVEAVAATSAWAEVARLLKAVARDGAAATVLARAPRVVVLNEFLLNTTS
jgi:hypothetical protein